MINKNIRVVMSVLPPFLPPLLFQQREQASCPPVATCVKCATRIPPTGVTNWCLYHTGHRHTLSKGFAIFRRATPFQFQRVPHDLPKKANQSRPTMLRPECKSSNTKAAKTHLLGSARPSRISACRLSRWAQPSVPVKKETDHRASSEFP